MWVTMVSIFSMISFVGGGHGGGHESFLTVRYGLYVSFSYFPIITFLRLDPNVVIVSMVTSVGI